MLRRLTVKNLAIVEDLELELGRGLNVITGETGAGKSILVDEVDTGIGGHTAEFIGRKLRALAPQDQVLCVTHLPQIAALADRHFRAEKRVVGGRTVAGVNPLTGKERIGEIARMLGGEKVAETALKHARALLQGAGQAP